MAEQDRWLVGERIWNENRYTPLGFILVHAAVIGWMKLRRWWHARGTGRRGGYM